MPQPQDQIAEFLGSVLSFFCFTKIMEELIQLNMNTS